VSTVHKALALLDLFTSKTPTLGLSEIARLADLDRATARRHILALSDFGLLEFVPASKTYRLGPALIVLGGKRENQVPIRKAIEPIVDEISAETMETTHATWMINGSFTTISVRESPHAARVHLDYGEVLPLHCTASGIGFLAHSDPAFTDEVLSGTLEKYLESTVVDKTKLLKEIEAARARGYAVNPGTYEPDLVGVGTAIRDPSGQARGALAIAAPVSRVSDEKIEAWGKLLQRGTEKINKLIADI
jgi:DNA-binding IclR family transcriptional regulator